MDIEVRNMSDTKSTSSATGGGNAQELFQEEIEPVEIHQSGGGPQPEEPAVQGQNIPPGQEVEEEGAPEAEGPHVASDVQEHFQPDPGDIYENGPEINGTEPPN
ncbi:G antigen 6 isoform X2 [Oryctolagus cuniculus]|uniref:G antigen 6 isoform X2 n=1 Tax=Oryctolagus cuniculus TaxID=9986 RepID=UPI00222F1EAF|nr:putative G antigen family E member 3 isoform X2 [Oryctolagus cuniculus]